MILLTVRLDNLKYINNNKKVIIKGMDRVIDIVEQQSKNWNIIRVAEFNGIIKREDYDDIKEWIYKPRIISNKRRKVQVLFTV